MNIFFTTSRNFLFLLLLLCLTTSLNLQAQNEKPKFGKVSMADLKMIRYDKDTSAEAVILSDIGSSYFDYNKDNDDFDLIYERFLRIKIITKNGYSWGNQEIWLYHNDQLEEKVTSLKACTYNLFDKKIVETKIDNGSVFDEKADINWTIRKFTLPAIKEGSIIDIYYSIKSPFFFNLQPWGFQNVIPEKYSEYEVRIPEYFNYKKMVTGYYPFFINEFSTNLITKTYQETETPANTVNVSRPRTSTYDINYKENIYRLAAKDVPAMRSEKFTSSMKNYHTRVEYELNSYQFPHASFHDFTSTWDQIIHKLLANENFGGQLNRTGIVKEAAQEVISKSSDPLERMILAYDYIRTHMKWNSQMAKYPTTNLRKAFSENKGNAADVNLNLILLLKELGINANPVLLSTRNNGTIRENSPNLTRLNYVVACAEIAGKKHLLDATDIDRPYTMLPFRCLNGKGILAIKDSVQWIDLLNSEKENTRYYGEFKFTQSGEIEGKVNVTYDGYPAFNNREQIRTKGTDQYIKDLKDEFKTAHLDSVKVENAELTSPLKLSYDLHSQELVENNVNMIFFNTLFGMGENTNPLIAEKREYPVDFGCPIKESYIFVIDVPEGFSVESLPQKVALALPDNAGTFKFTASQVGNKIAINSVFNLTKTFFVMSEYADLREFYTRMVAKQAEKIVIKKS